MANPIGRGGSGFLGFGIRVATSTRRIVAGDGSALLCVGRSQAFLRGLLGGDNPDMLLRAVVYRARQSSVRIARRGWSRQPRHRPLCKARRNRGIFGGSCEAIAGAAIIAWS